ncbi:MULTISPECIES: MATE family efflux transporter [Butyricimonas]|uniref:MATE family efflux transporter n=1 Tax=Butyricimonas TaxID=574697 RepID=UPI001D082854|nr:MULTISPECIES: MATE family efflux transporter [Butyricimonas]MCB6974912.1 MATE family efflux transporter [Butyricimonas synergistica]MCG4521654.1 MATE family efflux transporter [Butyricimonas sp. DFI.6.44]
MTDVKDSAPLVLGTEKIGKLLMQYAIPAIIAMTASSLYNMVDSIFIGHGVGPLAIAGLAITFPLMNLAAAFGSLVGVGASTLVAIKLGQRDKESANQVLGNVVLMNAIIGLVFMTVALVFLDPILLFFGASPDTLPYAREYMEVILGGNLVTHIYMGLNEVLRASGYPKKAMTATLMAVIVNCVLDALFILVFEWGIRGAALATIAAQVISLSWQLHHFFDKKSFLHFQRGIFGLKRHIVGGMLAIGLSPFLMNLCACFVVILINKSLKAHGGDLAIGAYGIVNRVVFLFIMIVMGFNQGMQPIAGYNFGARQYVRLKQVLKYTIFCGVAVTTTGFLAGQLFPRSIVYLFTTDADLIHIAVEGLRIVVVCFPVVGFQMVTSSFFQSIGMAKKAIFLSLTRQLLFLIPSLLIFPNFFGTVGVWMSMPVADAIATVVAALMLRWQLKHLNV